MATYTVKWSGSIGAGTSYGTVTCKTGKFTLPAGQKFKRFKATKSGGALTLSVGNLSWGEWTTDKSKFAWSDGKACTLKVYNTGANVAVTLTVTFETEDLPKRAVTCAVSGGGTLTANVSTAYNGQTVTLTPKANTGWYFGSYSSSPAVSFSGNTFVMPNSAITVTAKFVQSGYAVTVNSEDTEMGTVSDSGTYTYGSTANLIATPKPGYKFTGWTTTGGTIADASAATTTLTVPASAVTVTAHFERSQSLVGYYNGEAFEDCSVRYYDGTDWQDCEVYYYDGTDWNHCSNL